MNLLNKLALAAFAAVLPLASPLAIAQEHGAADHDETTTEPVGDSKLVPGARQAPDVAVDIPAARDGDDEIAPSDAAELDGDDDQSALGELATGEKSIHHPDGRR